MGKTDIDGYVRPVDATAIVRDLQVKGGREADWFSRNAAARVEAILGDDGQRRTRTRIGADGGRRALPSGVTTSRAAAAGFWGRTHRLKETL